MGSGGSKKPKKEKQSDQLVPRIPPTIIEVQPEYSAPTQSPHLPSVSSPQPSVHSRTRSMQSPALSEPNRASQLKSRSSQKRSPTSGLSDEKPATNGRAPSVSSQSSSEKSVTNLPNGSARHSPLEERDNISRRDSVNTPLPSINNPQKRSPTRSSSRTSTATPPPAPVLRPRTNSSSSSKYHSHAHRKISTGSHGQVNHCSHCPHCQRMNKLTNTSSPKPKWLTERPENQQVRIMMDEYDIEAVKKKLVADNGHIPGSYDYQPQLIMEQVDDYDIKQQNYFTQPFIAKTKPRVLATSTPFPEYDFLQRREQRLNKPHTLLLFTD